MKLLVGLGNPGAAYAATRHNTGFMALERFAAAHDRPRWKSARQALQAVVTLGEQTLVLLKPMTYMNLSGSAVAAALRFYRVALPDLLVVVDDTALECGVIRLRAAGSSGGHNGLRSIEAALGSAAAPGQTGRDYARLRIGIGARGAVPLETYVLSPFSAAQWPRMESALSQAVDAIQCWATRGLTAAMNRGQAAAGAGAAEE